MKTLIVILRVLAAAQCPVYSVVVVDFKKGKVLNICYCRRNERIRSSVLLHVSFCEIIFKQKILSLQSLQYIVGRVLHQVCRVGGAVRGLLHFRGGASHDEAARGEDEVEGEDQEVSIEGSLNKAVPLDLQQVHDDVLNKI